MSEKFYYMYKQGRQCFQRLIVMFYLVNIVDAHLELFFGDDRVWDESGSLPQDAVR